jgi:hypothetical protein
MKDEVKTLVEEKNKLSYEIYLLEEQYMEKVEALEDIVNKVFEELWEKHFGAYVLSVYIPEIREESKRMVTQLSRANFNVREADVILRYSREYKHIASHGLPTTRENILLFKKELEETLGLEVHEHGLS